MKTQTSIKEVNRKLDKSLALYSGNYNLKDYITPDDNDLSVEIYLQMYVDGLKYWLYFQNQLIEMEEFEICSKIKKLMEFEFQDIINILKDFGYEHPDSVVFAIREHHENKYLKAILN